MSTQGGIAGKVILVTGVTSGIGRGIAKEFAREGCRVVICGRNEEKLRQAAATFTWFGTHGAERTDVFDQ